MAYTYSSTNGHQTSSHSSFIPGWRDLLLQVKIQHPQNSVHGILFFRQLHLPSHPLLHPHFIRCIIASGAGGFIHRTGEKWLEPASMSNQMQQVLGGVDDFRQLSSKSWLCNVHGVYVIRKYILIRKSLCRLAYLYPSASDSAPDTGAL